MTTRAGFAAIIGAPNAGKSTLTNRLVGAKVTIVTQKVQTTRFPVRGVAMEGEAQIVLVDTPGIFAPRRRLDRAMVRSAWGGAEDADVTVHLIDVQAELAAAEPGAKAADKRAAQDVETIIEGLKASGKQVILALNKIDGVKRDRLLGLAQRLFDTGGKLPYGGGFPGTDYAGATMGTIALAESGVGRKAVTKTTKYLKKSSDTWVTANGSDSPAALAMLILLADATGENPKDFGGINLMSRLAKTRQ